MKKPVAVQRQTLSEEISMWLKSVPSVEQAKELIKNTKSLCQKGGFRLHKFTSNSREVLNSVPEEDRATDAKDHRLISNDTDVERALGVHWCIESDMLQFRIILQDKPPTQRGILSTVSSVFDPLRLGRSIHLGRQANSSRVVP